MIDEKSTTNLCTGMNFNSSCRSSPIGPNTSDQFEIVIPQPMVHAMCPNSVQSGVSEEKSLDDSSPPDRERGRYQYLLEYAETFRVPRDPCKEQ